MNARGLSALCVVLLLAGCADRMSVRPGAQYSAWDAPSRAARRILVTFVDRGVERAPLAHADQYRPRGTYRSSAWGRRIATKLAGDYKLHQVADWPISVLGVHCVVYEIASDRSIEQVLKWISQDKRIESVQRMHLFRVLSDPYYGLQTGLHSMQIETAHRWATGRDVTIAIIDTGVDFDHPDLKGQVSESQDLVTDHRFRFVDDIHGTALAGVIAAVADNGEGILGTAPSSKLIALKACWPEKPHALSALCDSLTLAKALNKVIALKPNILNLSFTGPPDPLLYRLVNRATEAGIIVVTADAANPDPSQNFPASMENVLAVRAALGRERAKPVTPASAIVAPGSDILTTFPHGVYDFASGSSLAAAHVSGVVALLLELQPGLSAVQLQKILQATVDDPSQALNSKVSGMVNASAAIAKLRGMTTLRAPHTAQAPKTR